MKLLHRIGTSRWFRAGVLAWAGLPTLFLFFNLTLAADPAASMAKVRLGTVILDGGVATPAGPVAIGPKLVAMVSQRLGVELVPFPSEQALHEAVLAREVAGGMIVPANATAQVMAGTPIGLSFVRSDANDAFTGSLTASLAASLGPTLSAAIPALQSGAAPAPLVTVTPSNVAPAGDFRFPGLPGPLLFPIWIAGVAFAVLLSRAGDEARARDGGQGVATVARAGAAEAALAVVGAAIVALVGAVDIALFTGRWDLNWAGLVGILWLALIATAWILLGLVRAFTLAGGAILGVLALFVQQAIAGASYPSSFAPDLVSWAAPIAPLRYLVDGLRDVLIGGSTLDEMAVGLVWLAVAGAALLAAGTLRLAVAARRGEGGPVPAPAG